MKKYVLIALILLASFSGCLKDVENSSEGNVSVDDADSAYQEDVFSEGLDSRAEQVRVRYDPEGNMVCYIYRGGLTASATGSGGIWCTHISNTDYFPADFE